MWYCVLALVLAAEPTPGSAEALFKQQEQQLLKSKTFQSELEIALTPGKDNSMKGRLLLAQGNKMRMDLAGSFMGKEGKVSMISDGTTMRMTSNDLPSKDQAATKELSLIGFASLSRAGIFVPLFMSVKTKAPGEKPDPFDIDKQLAISDLKLGKKEMVAGKETQALEYKLLLKSSPEPFLVTLWLDTKTHLPVKRVLTAKKDKEELTVTETYTKAVSDEKIADKEFALPK